MISDEIKAGIKYHENKIIEASVLNNACMHDYHSSKKESCEYFLPKIEQQEALIKEIIEALNNTEIKLSEMTSGNKPAQYSLIVNAQRKVNKLLIQKVQEILK